MSSHSPPSSPMQSPLLAAGSSQRSLESTFDDLLRECGRLRLLVVGKSGVGKSSLIRETFKVASLEASHGERGISDIRKEYTSDENARFVVHDSQGYEPGETDNYDTLKIFIRERSQRSRLAEKLHVIWLCIAIPIAGGRVFETGTEELLRLAHELAVPVIIVFTKYDEIVVVKEMSLWKKNPKIGDEELERQSRAEADEDFETMCVGPLNRLRSRLGCGPMPYVKVSVSLSYEPLLSELVEVTEKHITESVSNLLMAVAQRVSDESKIEASIAIGKKKYWRGLASSAYFPGFTMQKCLHVLHGDIVKTWNFSDPERLLLGTGFEASISQLVESSVETTDIKKRAGKGLGVAGAVAGVAGAAAGPAAVVVVPAVFAGVFFAHWVYETYKRTSTTLCQLMGYIVHLINVMQSLFNDVQGRSISGPIIESAFEAYRTSPVSTRVREEIVTFVKDMKLFQFLDKDFVLEELIRLIWLHRFPPTNR